VAALQTDNCLLQQCSGMTRNGIAVQTIEMYNFVWPAYINL